MLTSPDTHQQSIPVGCHRALGRGSPGWDEVQGEPFSWIHVFPQGRCSLWSLWPLPKRPHIPGWGMCPERGFHPSPTGPGTGAEVGLQWSLPLWLSHTGSDMQTAASCGTSLQGQLKPSPVAGASQGNARAEGQVRASAASPQLGPDPAQWVDPGGFHETGVSLSSLPIVAAPSIPPDSPGSQAWLCLSLFAWHSRGDRNTRGDGGSRVWSGGEGASRHLTDPPHPFVLPPSCLLQAQIRDERLTGQIFMKATSSTLAFPKQPPPPLAPNPVAN